MRRKNSFARPCTAASAPMSEALMPLDISPPTVLPSASSVTRAPRSAAATAAATPAGGAPRPVRGGGGGGPGAPPRLQADRHEEGQGGEQCSGTAAQQEAAR